MTEIEQLGLDLPDWKIIKKLGQGGQGMTWLVQSRTGSEQGVLKILRRPDDQQARARMHREVANLRSLHPTAARVPKVLEDNTKEFEIMDTVLYFIMEYIEGQTLLDYISEHTPLDIDNSLAICNSLLETIRIGIEANILHRDLKPENIIIRSGNVADVVIVDYGLSFNAEQDDNLTKVDERLDNRFLTLPERRAKDGNKRDVRSDLTSIVGVLYYCLTGEFPGDLYRDDGRLVHRGDQRRIINWHPEGEWRNRVETLMDRGLNPDLQQRFQTPEELSQRLAYVLAGRPGNNEQEGNVYDIARRAAQLLRKHDRPTQLNGYNDAVSNYLPQIVNRFNTVIAEISKQGFIGTLSAPNGAPVTNKVWPELLPKTLGATIMYKIQGAVRWTIQYGIKVEFNEISFMRKTWLEDGRTASSNRREKETDWLPVAYFDGDNGPPANLAEDLKRDFEMVVGEGINNILRTLIPGVPDG